MLLSNARFFTPPSNWQPGAVKPEGKVRIENISGKEITRLELSFHYAGGPVADGYLGAEVTGLKPDASVEYAEKGVSANGQEMDSPCSLSVGPTGAEFADGSYWAAPRVLQRPMVLALLVSDTKADLKIMQCKLDGQSYTAHLRVDGPHVVAYKLGVVKDTPSRSQVALGVWADIDEGHRSTGAMVTDNGQGLRGTRLFERDDEPTFYRGEEVGKRPGGVAIFIAAVEYDDGRVWEQDTSRDALLWNNNY